MPADRSDERCGQEVERHERLERERIMSFANEEWMDRMQSLKRIDVTAGVAQTPRIANRGVHISTTDSNDV